MARVLAGSITLELTAREAGVLLKVLRSIRGHPSGPRGVSSAIGYAMEEAGVVPADFDVSQNMQIGEGCEGWQP